MQALILSGKSACFRLKTVLLPLCMLAVMMLAPQVMAATITVNSTLDTTGNGSICTLRDAISSANNDSATGGCAAGSEDDTVTFAAGLSGQTIILSSELPNLKNNITIDGSGLASHIQISGNHSVRVFRIDHGKTVVLKNLDIINGKVVLFYSGGAINNNGGALTVSGSSFSGNSARNGGGIHIHNGGTLTVSNSTFSANSAGF